MELGTLSVKCTAELRELEVGLTRGANMVKGYSAKVEGYLQTHREEWMRIGKQATIAVGVVSYAFQRMAKEAAAYADEIQRAARGTGLSFQMIQQLKYAAEISEGSLEGMVKVISKLTSSAADYVAGNPKAVAAFSMLGIKATDSQGKIKPGVDLMFELADAYKAGQISGEKFSAALDLVGLRGASSYLPMLGEGSKRLKELMAESSKFGNLTDAQIESLDKYGDEMLQINKTMMILKAGIAEDLLPLLSMMQRQILRTAEGWAGWNIVLDVSLKKIYEFAEGLNRIWAMVAKANPFGHEFATKTAAEWTALADQAEKMQGNLSADIKMQQEKIVELNKQIGLIKDYNDIAEAGQKDRLSGLDDELSKMDKNKDKFSEFIGAFEWKPVALLAGGGREFGSRAPVVSQQGGNTVLQLTVNVQGRSELHSELDRQLDRLAIIN